MVESVAAIVHRKQRAEVRGHHIDAGRRRFLDFSHQLFDVEGRQQFDEPAEEHGRQRHQEAGSVKHRRRRHRPVIGTVAAMLLPEPDSPTMPSTS